MEVKNIVNGLNLLYPNPVCELNFKKDYELVISVMLSAQTTDKRVNMVTEYIYDKYDSLEKLNELSIEEISSLINTVGLYKVKSVYFKKIVEELIKYDKVPQDRNLLESIPGLGRKSANVILSVLYNEPYIAVDTHVTRVSKRLDIASDNDDVLVIEKKLYKFFEGYDYKKIGQQLVLFGRYTCTSKKPNCSKCPLIKSCTYKDKNI